MKLALLPALCWSARIAAAATGLVYIQDPSSEPRASAQRTLSPVEARLVLAQRAGVEDYHTADLLSSGAIEAINDFGERESLFEERRKYRRAFILVDGVESIPSLNDGRSFHISPLPSSPSTSARALFLDLARQSCPYHYARLSDAELAERLQEESTRTWPTLETDFYIAGSKARFEEALEVLKRKDGWSITAIIVPPPSKEAETDSTIASWEWGTYTMPGAQSSLRKRQDHLEPQEEPLESDFKPVESHTSPIHSLASSSPLPGILPACYPSLSSCQSTTNNCTSHGTCRLLYTNKDADDKSPQKQCYACSCSPTTQTDSEGRVSTTYWGGPACQKKDVSVSFWLIVFFTVLMVGLVSFAVGSVWSMGEEELPSVIGAGVSGVGARK